MSNFTTFNYPASGLNNVAEYQASGLPWVTSSVATVSPMHYTFPYVTNEIIVHNLGPSGSANIRVGFTQNGVNGTNYYAVEAGEQATLRLRVKDLYIRSETSTVSYSVCAGLTQILSRGFPILTGSAAGFNPNTTGSYYGYSGIG